MTLRIVVCQVTYNLVDSLSNTTEVSREINEVHISGMSIHAEVKDIPVYLKYLLSSKRFHFSSFNQLSQLKVAASHLTFVRGTVKITAGHFHRLAKVCIVDSIITHVHEPLIWLLNVASTIERDLKEQYPVTAHVPNFDFLTEYREIQEMRAE